MAKTKGNKPKPKTKEPRQAVDADGLNPRERLFVDAYTVDPNGRQAAIAAGYSQKAAAQQASRLLNNVNVQKAIRKARRRLEIRTGVTAERVRLELAKIAFGDLSDVATWGVVGRGTPAERNTFVLHDLDDLDDDHKALIQSVKVKRKWEPDASGVFAEVEETTVKLYDKLRALELLGKHLGMFDQKLKIQIDTPLDLDKLTLEQKLQLEALLDAAAIEE